MAPPIARRITLYKADEEACYEAAFKFDETRGKLLDVYGRFAVQALAHMKSRHDAEVALEALNHKNISGSSIEVFRTNV